MILVQEQNVIAEGNGYDLKSLLEGQGVRFGIVSIPVGARIPLHDTGSHAQDEYSYIVKGSLVMESGPHQYQVNAGDATLIPAGEAHWCYNNGKEEALVVWSLVSK
ncbi:cupin domain-containing protein [Alicyclobacillus fastidiosus]|uniref:Cupin domain-containing protein n=1 Tax=Alicyclobacillus fastidiosus TaxID=392011 RepID=A0ABY6ZC86_9BACL|nr:cupin domain-containing protein [Alicyclobacillus fastidiosus]WAH39731.1 cupin domain-containing protein [Alicyclobacillus fastidiosus]GMA60959.1 hypothetical protein GCM10025859_13990 [Alicyclobacillus fastidiosus]